MDGIFDTGTEQYRWWYCYGKHDYNHVHRGNGIGGEFAPAGPVPWRCIRSDSVNVAPQGVCGMFFGELWNGIGRIVLTSTAEETKGKR